MENTSLSLSDLVNTSITEPAKEVNLADAIIAKATDPATPDPTKEVITPAPVTPAAAPTEAEKIALAAANNPDATVEPTEEELAATAEAEAAALAAAEGDTETFTPEKFYSTLDAMYGEDINADIDYGTTDSMSPEGVYIREQHIRDRGIAEFAESMKENDPRAYSYFLHRSNGGSDDEFFSNKSFVLPDLQEIQGNVDLQRDLYQQVLLNRGNSQKQVDAIIKMAIADGELLAESEAAYNTIKANESKVAADADTANKANKAREAGEFKAFGDAVNAVLDSNSALKFIIPKTEKEQFSEVFRKNVHYENGNFYMIKPMNKENMAEVMEAELFSYLKGDVSKLVQKQATKVAAVRTLQRLAPKAVPGSTATPAGSHALSDIL